MLTPDAAITDPCPPRTVEGSLSVVEADDSGRDGLGSATAPLLGTCFPFFPLFLAFSSSSLAFSSSCFLFNSSFFFCLKKTQFMEDLVVLIG